MFNPKDECNLHEEFLQGVWSELSQYKMPFNKQYIVDELSILYTEERKPQIKKLQSKWNSINDSYFEEVEKITGEQAKEAEYVATICIKMNTLGFSNPLRPSNQFLIGIDLLNSKDLLYIVAHELFHTIYYEFYPKYKFGSVSPTILTESTALLSLMYTDMSRLFPESDMHKEDFKNAYPQTKNNWKQLLEYWVERESFSDYIFLAHKQFC